MDTIQDNFIYLRKLTLKDISNNYLKWVNNKEVTKFMEIRDETFTKNDLINFVTNINNSDYQILFGIFDISKNKHIGNIKLEYLNKEKEKVSLGLFIGEKSYWGKGYATKAINLATSYGFDKLVITTIIAGAFTKNIGSIKAFEKNGYEITKLIKNEAFIDNQWEDSVILQKIAKKKNK